MIFSMRKSSIVPDNVINPLNNFNWLRKLNEGMHNAIRERDGLRKIDIGKESINFVDINRNKNCFPPELCKVKVRVYNRQSLNKIIQNANCNKLEVISLSPIKSYYMDIDSLFKNMTKYDKLHLSDLLKEEETEGFNIKKIFNRLSIFKKNQIFDLIKAERKKDSDLLRVADFLQKYQATPKLYHTMIPRIGLHRITSSIIKEDFVKLIGWTENLWREFCELRGD